MIVERPHRKKGGTEGYDMQEGSLGGIKPGTLRACGMHLRTQDALRPPEFDKVVYCCSYMLEFNEIHGG